MTLAADHEVFPTPQMQVGADEARVTHAIAGHVDQHVLMLSRNLLFMTDRARKLSIDPVDRISTPRQHRQFMMLVSQCRQHSFVLAKLNAISTNARLTQTKALLSCSELQNEEAAGWTFQQTGMHSTILAL